MSIQDADNLRKLALVSIARYFVIADLTGSSGLLVLLIFAEVSLISSIMLVRSLPMSSRRSETRSAILYLYGGVSEAAASCSSKHLRPLSLLIRTL